jgi:uncharacterized protein YjiS (DUF1127 family)
VQHSLTSEREQVQGRQRQAIGKSLLISPASARRRTNDGRIALVSATGNVALRAVLAVVTPLYHGLKRLMAVQHSRSEVRSLIRYDDRLLSDMGISCADLEDARTSSFWEDPGLILRERAIERRLNMLPTSSDSELGRTSPSNRPHLPDT